MWGVAIICCLAMVVLFFIGLDAKYFTPTGRSFWFAWAWRFAVLWLLAVIAAKL